MDSLTNETSPYSRKQSVLAGLELSRLRGLEFGALDAPMVARGEGSIVYVDHTSTSELRLKYANDPKVKLDRLVDVDIVWQGGQPLADLTDERFDYAVASHVVEHVPNLIGWLNNIATVLSPGGQVRLVIPDRRFSFDYFRRESRIADVLSAFLINSKIPMPVQIIDHFADHADLSVQEAWEAFPHQPRVERTNGDAGGFELARRVFNEGGYHDVHCWVFTPLSFADIMLRTARLGLHTFACRFLETTRHGQLEFTCALQLEERSELAIASWASALRSLETEQLSRDTLQAELEKSELERNAAYARLKAIEESKAWRAVLRYRRIKQFLKSARQRITK